MAEKESEKEPESSVVTFTDEDGLVHYTDRHSKVYLKHLARQEAKAAASAEPAPSTGTDPAFPGVVHREPAEAESAEDTAGKPRTPRRADQKA